MPYIQRNKDGKIKGVFARLQQGYAEEYLSDDNVEVMEYLNPVPSQAELDEQNLVELRRKALEVEQEKILMSGTTLEAVSYQNEKTRIG